MRCGRTDLCAPLHHCQDEPALNAGLLSFRIFLPLAALPSLRQVKEFTSSSARSRGGRCSKGLVIAHLLCPSLSPSPPLGAKEKAAVAVTAGVAAPAGAVSAPAPRR